MAWWRSGPVWLRGFIAVIALYATLLQGFVVSVTARGSTGQDAILCFTSGIAQDDPSGEHRRHDTSCCMSLCRNGLATGSPPVAAGFAATTPDPGYSPAGWTPFAPVVTDRTVERAHPARGPPSAA